MTRELTELAFKDSALNCTDSAIDRETHVTNATSVNHSQSIENLQAAFNHFLDGEFKQAKSKLALKKPYTKSSFNRTSLILGIHLFESDSAAINKALQAFGNVVSNEDEQHYLIIFQAYINKNLINASQSISHLYQRNPNNPILQFLLAKIKSDKQEFGKALTLLLMLSPALQKQLTVKSLIYFCLEQITLNKGNQIIEDKVVEYLQDNNHSFLPIRQLVTSILKAKYQLASINSELISKLSEDCIFLSYIENSLIYDPDMENFLVKVRSYLLTKDILSLQYVDLLIMKGLAISNFHSEYISKISDKDQKSLNKYQDDITNKSKGEVAVYFKVAMFELSADIQSIASGNKNDNKNDKLAKILFDDLISKTTKQVRLEQEFSAQIENITSIDDDISKSVRKQYEEAPYPRWVNIRENAIKVSYIEHTKRNIHQRWRSLPVFSKKKIRLLFAGCGTGAQVLYYAKNFTHVEIVAIDLSKSSLAYASKQAETFGISNVRFYQADILKLDNQELIDKLGQFNIIDSCGVLHHLNDPGAGLNTLKRYLKPNGLFRLALYSTRAREHITAFRAPFSKNGDNVLNKKYIIQERQKVLETPNNEDHQKMIASPDFYSYGGCRDLLFHAKEHTFTPLSLHRYLERQNIDFLGFTNVQALTWKNFRDQFPLVKSHQAIPSFPSELDLTCWEKFDEINPRSFAGMYHFYCAPSAVNH